LFFFLEKTTALGPKDFCKEMKRHDPPPKPVKLQFEEGSTSNPQPIVGNRQIFSNIVINLNDNLDFDLNEKPDEE